MGATALAASNSPIRGLADISLSLVAICRRNATPVSPFRLSACGRHDPGSGRRREFAGRLVHQVKYTFGDREMRTAQFQFPFLLTLGDAGKGAQVGETDPDARIF